MEFKAEHLRDAIEAGNTGPIIRALALTIRNNRSIPDAARAGLEKRCEIFQRELIDRAWWGTFGEKYERHKGGKYGRIRA